MLCKRNKYLKSSKFSIENNFLLSKSNFFHRWRNERNVLQHVHPSERDSKEDRLHHVSGRTGGRRQDRVLLPPAAPQGAESLLVSS